MVHYDCIWEDTRSLYAAIAYYVSISGELLTASDAIKKGISIKDWNDTIMIMIFNFVASYIILCIMLIQHACVYT